MADHVYKLFVMPGCPWCRRVDDYLSANGIEVPHADITADPANREELLRVGGKVQVPCLFVDGEPMYESGDIIDYFARR